ncbi:hypothetical protein BRADI_3g43205v3 [Brachypodium distachyon]|uniref:Uncharacterized protein n=1 Tax=Brachypodium distachyon TaxID=15368 RepID=A0A0Q3FIF9_BRADI|nr:hypothetical protein BRADI_3g43205v3 [Brachypodium distachyon]
MAVVEEGDDDWQERCSATALARPGPASAVGQHGEHADEPFHQRRREAHVAGPSEPVRPHGEAEAEQNTGGEGDPFRPVVASTRRRGVGSAGSWIGGSGVACLQLCGRGVGRQGRICFSSARLVGPRSKRAVMQNRRVQLSSRMYEYRTRT